VYVTPKFTQKVAQNAILLLLPVKFHLCRKNSATKCLCVQTSSGNVVATSFLYLTVHRWITGDVSIYLKLALKVIPTNSENADFDRFCVTVPQPWELAKISIIANRKSTMRFPSSHRWTLCVTPKSTKGWLKTELYIFLRCLSYLRCRYRNRRHFKFGMPINHSKSQPTNDTEMGVVRSREPLKFLVGTHYISVTPGAKVIKFCTQVGYIKSQHTDNKSPLNRAWLASRDPLQILRPPMISLEWLKLESSNFAHR